MEYNGYFIGNLESLLLHDILQVQQEILSELKRINGVPVVEAIHNTAEPEKDVAIEEEQEKPAIEAVKAAPKKPRKPTKKKSGTKKSVKSKV